MVTVASVRVNVAPGESVNAEELPLAIRLDIVLLVGLREVEQWRCLHDVASAVNSKLASVSIRVVRLRNTHHTSG